MAMVKVGNVVVMCMVVVAVATSLHAEASLSCGQVEGSMSNCLGYLKNGGTVSPACCGGVKSLLRMAKSTTDRQDACRCLQDAAKKIPGINPGFASSLPGKCRVNIPYKISPSTDCSRW
ncbi:non-specific lipid-transfer protein 1-like [Cornus florida]|uniref:non-specific lipid-transfer protein 1-like n=1 Tax=Cornus florida TaxID=4283 RepID=UPI002899C154|nr:non-specific lipid-transfer protein 1-like [Cornus florida]